MELIAKNNPNQNLTPLELQIMQILWQDGPATVNEVRPKLKAVLAYTTVQTMLNVLLRKGKVKRVQEGRAFRYRAEREATGNALRARGGQPIEERSRCSDGRWSFDGKTLRFAKPIAVREHRDTSMPLTLHVRD